MTILLKFLTNILLFSIIKEGFMLKKNFLGIILTMIILLTTACGSTGQNQSNEKM